MNCQDAKKRIHNDLDGDLAKEDRDQLLQHVEQCPSCKQHLYELEKTMQLLQSQPPVEAPSDFVQKVMQRLPQQRKKYRVKEWMKAHPFIVAASLFLILMSGSLFSIWSAGPSDLSVSAPNTDQLIVKQDQNLVIVPESVVIEGDLIVQNGNVEVHGKIIGDVVVTDGHVYLASTANIAGQVEEIDQFMQWTWFHIQRWIKEAIPNRE